MKKLKINKIAIEKNNEGYSLVSIIERENRNPFELKFDYSINKIDFIDSDFADPFLVSLLPYAMEFGYDIFCENPISSDLYYKLTNDFIPVLSKYSKFFNNIEITSNEIKPKKIINNYAVATGCSCGVDSLHTIYKNHINTSNNKKTHLLTHLVVVNSGACGWMGGEESKKWFDIEVERGKNVAKDLNLEFISINTNLMEFYQRDHGHSGFSRLSGVILGLDKLFNTYYYASSYELDNLKLNTDDDASFLYLTSNCVSDRNIMFNVTGNYEDRYDKVKLIENYSIAQKYINVCWNGGNNCGKCEKCLRTIGAFYARNKLNNYDEILNTKYFLKHKTRCIAKMIAWKNEHDRQYSFLKDIRKNHHFRYFIAWILCYIYYYPKNLIRSFLKRIIKKDSFLYKKLKGERRK